MKVYRGKASFRPLAGLSCINHHIQNLKSQLTFMFPSPRGVELHKPKVWQT